MMIGIQALRTPLQRYERSPNEGTGLTHEHPIERNEKHTVRMKEVNQIQVGRRDKSPNRTPARLSHHSWILDHHTCLLPPHHHLQYLLLLLRLLPLPLLRPLPPLQETHTMRAHTSMFLRFRSVPQAAHPHLYPYQVREERGRLTVIGVGISSVVLRVGVRECG